MDQRDRFRELLRRYGDKAYNFAYRLTGNDADARDLVQEACVRAYEKIDRYDPSRPFDAWFLSVLRNMFVDGTRRAATRPALSFDSAMPGGEAAFDEILAGPDPDPSLTAERADEDALVQRALDALPAHYRAAVVLADIEGLDYAAVAEVLGIPVGTVRSRLHQGRALLRRVLEKDSPEETHGRA